MFSEMIIKDAESAPQTLEYKIKNGLAGLAEQEEALNDSWTAYLFAREVKYANIERCQKVACKHPEYAYYFARHIEDANIEYCQEAACKSPRWACYFARDVIGADIEKCRKACKGTQYAF